MWHDITVATINHTEPCTVCLLPISKGDKMCVYATAGGGLDDGLIIWMHHDCHSPHN